MQKNQKFYVCKHCGNMVGMIKDAGVNPVCCGEKMEEVIANTVDAAKEKHVPVVTIDNNKINVKVGEVEHPMTSEHLIEWVYIKTVEGGQRKALNDKPEADFIITDSDKVLEVYAYCNLHGLWKVEL